MISIPALAGAAAFFIGSDPLRRGLLVSTAIVQFALVVGTWLAQPTPALNGWLAEDALGRLFMTLTSALFLASSFYAVAYLREERSRSHSDSEEGFLFSNAREASFTGCLLFFLAAMTLVTLSQHLGLLWVAVEATTLASAPLIYFHRHHRSLEATWKYLLICSVGIALALLGIFFLAVAATSPGTAAVSLVLKDLISDAPHLNRLWLKAAFVLMLVGYGTKMGLAPFHTWLPDAHSEAPSVASALLSGALLNCAFLGILRIYQICVASGLVDFSERLLLVLGLLSMAVAAIFITGQVDYKRMLAYSSIEHMGILAVGVGLGGAGLFGAMLHVINHSLTKVMLFMVAGNLLAVYHTKTVKNVSGALQVLPVSGLLWVLGFLAITGSPPFGPFLSEFTILKAALDQGRSFVAIAYLIFLAIIVAGMATPVLAMAQGTPDSNVVVPAGRGVALSAVPAILGAAILLMGIYVPPVLSRTLHEAARLLGEH
ncbi:proton-conducting transporter transmembrane domain-containing protein [Candidatus Binatus sp.]|uniref:proton-conducting transporter transmembrane domain-containing protein n=1 Tax=Candidatus Binatus sp. TaxID=2811406 RepID=UPI003F9BC1F9